MPMHGGYMSKTRKMGLIVLGTAGIFLLLWQIPTVMDGVVKALLLCARSVIPALLIFMVLAECITVLLLSEPMCAGSGRWLVFILGAVCGFPIGAVAADTCVRRGMLSQQDACRILPYCNNASPAFVLGAIGNSMYGDTRVGVCIFAAQLTAALVLFLPLRLEKNGGALCAEHVSVREAFLTGVEKASASLLRITVLICFFSALLSVVRRFAPMWLYVPLATLLEIGSGAAAGSTVAGATGVALCGFACGWSGVCVFLQVLSVSKSIKVKEKVYLSSKLWQGILTGLLSFAFYKIWIGT